VEQPVILCGLGRVGWRVLEFLRATEMPVVVVDSKADPADPRLQQVRVVRGDFREPTVLTKAGIENARGVLIVASDDLVNIAAALVARRLNANVRIVVRMFNQNLIPRLGKAVSNIYAQSVSALTAPLLALSALTGEGLGAFTIHDERWQIVRLAVGANSPLIGRRIAELARHFEVQVLAQQSQGEPTPRLLLHVDGQAPLNAGDSLVVCGEPQHLAQLMPLGEGDEWESLLAGARFAGRIRRYGRMLWRALLEVDLALKICGSVLLVVVVCSTFIYWRFGLSTSLPDGLYRTISIIATGADMKADTYVGWQKVFVSFMRITGAVLTAAFTAIFTNYLLRARLGGALEIRRIPESGHIVVCGLGNVGFRVVKELLDCDQQVVVIERSRDNAFIGTCRRMGAAVIVGDATLLEVLKQARAGATRAVVATTTNDLVNLEIALLARELNPKQRVVVRLVDAQLAETIRDAANIRLAMSLPALAAPAFVAALYGDRVQSIFRIGPEMLGAVELLVQPNDPCLKDQFIRTLEVDYGLLPLAIPKHHGIITEAQLNYRLQEGDRFTVVGVMPDLERVFRREPAPAEWSVEVTAIPIPARAQVALLVRTENNCSAVDAEKLLEKLPLHLGKPRTRGQAVELLSLLEREKAEAKLVQIKA
jgi:Trk K+ transport system NAD-binding subunit